MSNEKLNSTDVFWKKWEKADSLDKPKLLKEIIKRLQETFDEDIEDLPPLTSEKLLNSYLQDLYSYARRSALNELRPKIVEMNKRITKIEKKILRKNNGN